VSIERNTRIGNYKIVKLLGSGGMGQVYLAKDIELDRNVALKFLPQDAEKDPTVVRRFLREARAASALNHPNIVTIYESGQAESGHFIVMELIEGKTLRLLIGSQPSLDSFLNLSLQMVRGLSAAHAANIIHRDIKPENLMVRDDGYVKILDFGLASREFTSELNVTSAMTLIDEAVMGSPRYMSPEQARGEKLTPATDIFSLGIVFYELATGQHPFGQESSLSVVNAILNQPVVAPCRINPDLSGTLDLLIQRMLDKNPRLRPTCAEVETILSEPAAREHSTSSKLQQSQVFVGREKERERLHAALQDTVEGKGGIVCVEGEAGLGKSSLVERFIAEASAKHTLWIGRGRSSERLAGTEAYVPMLEAMESLIFGPDGAVMARTMKLLAPTWYLQMMPATSGNEAVSQMLSQAQAGSQDRIRREFITFLQETTHSQAMVLFLDDLHWADVSTIDLLVSIASRLSSLRLLLIVTYRSAEMQLSKHPFLKVQHDLQARGICQTIAVQFLAQQDVQSFVDIQFPDQAFPADFISLLHARTEGNALFMVDVLRYLREQKIIVQTDGNWTLAESVPDIDRQLPESVRAMIQRSIDMLGEEQRRILVVASVQGYEFHAAVIAQVLSLDPANVEERLEELEKIHGLVRTLSEEIMPDRTLTVRCRFIHVLYQEALFSSLKPARRAILSVGVASCLEALYKDRIATVASKIAFLYEAARELDRAANYFHKAAQIASRVFAFEEAATLARHGLAALESLERTPERLHTELLLRVELGSALIPVKGFGDQEAQHTFAVAYQLRHSIEARVEVVAVLVGLFSFHIARAEIPKARALAEQLIDLGIELHDPAVVARGHGTFGAALYFNGEFVEAVRVLEDTLKQYEAGELQINFQFHSVNSGVTFLTIIAGSLMILGYPDQGLARVTAAVRLADSLSDPMSQAWAYFYAASISQTRPDIEATRIHVDSLFSLAMEHGLKFWKAHAIGLKGYLLCREGKLEEGIPMVRAGLEAVRLSGSLPSIPYFTAILAVALGRRGNPEEGLRIVDAEIPTVGPIALGELCRIKGELLAQLGASAADIDHWFEKSLSIAGRQQARLYQLRSLTSWTRVRKQEQLQKRLNQVFEAFTEGFDTVDLLTAKSLLAAYKAQT
jgi:tetratricopeptide (TPR) repeat protein